MPYFDQFPLLKYQFAGDIDQTLVTDILKRVKVRDSVLQTGQLYDMYIIRDGETPDMLADRFYRSSNLHWVLLITNTIINPFFDWPLDTPSLGAFINNKYGSANKYATHHYELVSPIPERNGLWLPHDTAFSDFGADLYNPNTESVIPVTNTDYETQLNDEARSIRIFKVELIPQLLAEFANYINV